MNHIYRSLWNDSTQSWVAVSEVARAPSRAGPVGPSGDVAKAGAGFALQALAAASLFVCGTLALANPTGGTVSAGSATINTSGAKVTVNQGSQNAAINWQNFSIGSGESVVFVQPNANSVALNRVVGADPSSILGSLSANGQVFLVNPNGILFGKGASVNVQGLVASTLGLGDADFMAGKYGFAGTNSKTVSNLGSIAADGGYVALLGAKVSNRGTITARLGSVALAGGQGVTLDIAGDSLLKVNVDQGAFSALVENGGLIQADGGQVLMTAQAAGQLLNTVVNNTGVVQARTVESRGGVIKLLGDMSTGSVDVGGTLDASAPSGGNGGNIETSAAKVAVAAGAAVTTLAASGQSGTWLIDPKDFTIASASTGTVSGAGVPNGDISGATLTTALATGNVTILSSEGGTAVGSGNINVNDTVTWAANTLTLNAANNVVVGSTAQQGILTASGTAGLVINTAITNGADAGVAGGKLIITDALSPTGGIACGTGCTSAFQGRVDLAATASFTMNSRAYTIIASLGTSSTDTTAHTLQGLQSRLTGDYVLGANIDATATSGWSNKFTPIGSYVDDYAGSTTHAPSIHQADTFDGTFLGLGHTISALKISSTAPIGTGLFAVTGGQDIGSIGNAIPVGNTLSLIQDVELIKPSVSGVEAVGSLVGLNGGIVTNTFVTGGVLGSVVGANNGSNYSVFVGGLVGENIYTISDSYANVATTSSNATTTINSKPAVAGIVGGLVGLNAATLTDSTSASAVSGYQYVGGLAGQNGGTITDSSASGPVTAISGGGTQLGGLAGYNTGTITGTSIAGNSTTLTSSSGSVTGTTDVGGLVGLNRGTIALSESSSSVTGTGSAVGGLVGENRGGDGFVGHAATSSAAGTVGVNGFTATITTSSSIGTVTGTGATDVGGLVGLNIGGTGGVGAAGCDSCLVGGTGGVGGLAAINQSYSTATVGGATNVGGLVGRNANGVIGVAGATSAGSPAGTGGAGGAGGAASITDTYAQATVSGTGSKIGGLVGYDVGISGTPSSVATSYSTSTLGGAGTAQGLAIGQDSAGTYTNVVYETRSGGTAFGSGSSAQVTAVAANALDVSGNYPNFKFSSGTTSGIWGITASSGNAPTLCALTVGCKIDVYVETLALVGGVLVSAAQASTYGNATPTFEDVLVTSNGSMFTLPSGVSVTFAATANLATPTSTAGGLTVTQPTSGTYAGAYTVGFDTGTTHQATFSGGNGSAQTLVGTYVLLDYSAPLSWTIKKAQVAVSAPNVAITYYSGSTLAQLSADSTLSAGTNSSISGGIYSADIGNITFNQAATGTFASRNAGTGIGISYTDSLTGTGAANYQLVPAPLSGTINKAPLVVAGTTVAAKTYDGTTSVGVSGGVLNPGTNNPIATASGVLTSDVSNVHLSAASTGTFGCATVVGCTSVSVVDSLTGSAASNYILASPTLSGMISPAALTLAVNSSGTSTLNGLAASDKTYDGSAAAAVTGPTTLVAGTGNTMSGGVHSGDVVALTTSSVTSGSFATVDAATHTQAVTLADTLTGAEASNYVLVLPTLAASISPAPLIVNASTANAKTYDGTTAATLSNGVTAPGTNNTIGTATGVFGSDAVTLVQAGTFASANAGGAQAVVVADTLTGAKALDYTLVQPSNVSAAIAKAPLTVVGTQVTDKTYDGTNGATVGGGTLAAGVGNTIGGTGVYSGDSSGVTLTTATSGSFASSNASLTTQAVTVLDTLALTGSAAGNYVLVAPTLSAFINPAPLTVSGRGASDKVYDGTTAASLTGTGTLVAAPGNTIGGVLPADAGDVTLNTTLSGTFASANAGASAQSVSTSDSLTLTNAALGNYVLVQPAALSARISPAQLLASGTSVADKTYNGSAAATLSGGTLAAGGNNAIGGNGVFSGDAVTLVQSGSFASVNASSAALAVTSTDSLAGAAAGNYALAVPTGLSALINPAPLTITGTTVATRTYDGSATAALSGGALGSTAGNTIGGNGVFGSDVAHLGVTLAPTGTFASVNANGSAQAVSVSDVLTGSAAGNYLLVQPALSGFINAAPLTATNTSVTNKTYDGSATAALNGATLAAASGNTLGGNGVYAGDVAGVAFSAAATGTFASVNASTNAQAVTVVDGLALSGSAAGNYVFVQPVLSGTITRAPLTVAGTSVAGKTYDGSNAATLSGGALALAAGNTIGGNGVLGSDAANLGLVLAPAGTFASVNASGSAQAVTVSDALSGSAAGNYVLLQPALAGFINPAPLTVTGTTVATRTYDGTTVANLGGGTLAPASGNTLGGNGVFAGDAASVALVLASTGNYASADARANARSVSVSDGLTLTGPASGNYLLVQPTLSGLVTQAPITVVGTTVVSKTYNGNAQATLANGAFAPVSTGTPATSNTIAGSGVAAADLANLVLNQAGTFAGSNASSATQAVTAGNSLSGAAAVNYVLVEPTGLSGTIAPAPLTVGNSIVTSKTYNGSNAAVVSGGQLVAGAGNTIGGSGVLSADAANVHLTTVNSGTFASVNASAGAQSVSVSDTLTVSGAAAGNYVLVEPALTGFINPAPLTVTGSSVAGKTYDGTRTATLGGGTLAPVLTGSASTSDTIASATGVLAADAGNVALVQAANFASVNASPSAQAVTATDSLVLAGAAGGNYVLVQPTGLSGVISPAPITVSGATVVGKTYNGTAAASFTGGALAPAAGNTIGGTGVVAADAANLRLTQTGTFASVNANPNPQAVSANDALTGSAAPNYVLLEPTGLAGTISPAPVTVSGTTVATRTYDGTTTATLSGGTLSAASGNTIGGTGVLSADAANVSLQTAPSGSFASPNAGSTAQSVSVTDTLTLTGSAAGNYALLQPATLTGFINPAPLTVTGSTAIDKTFDGTTLATLEGGTLAPVRNANAASSDNIASASGVLAGDAANVVLNSSGNFASSNASTAAQAVTLHDSLTLSGSAAGNYVLVQPGNLSGVISPATLTIAAAANTKTYDGTTSAAAAPVVTGLAIGTSVSSVSESYQSANVAGSGASTLAVNGGIVVNDGNYGNNYTLVTATAAGTINPATLTVIDTLVGNKVYDATKTTTVTGGVLVGLFNNDAVTLSQSGSFASANAGSAVALVGSDALSGAGASNYVLQQPTGLTGVIAPAPLTVAGTVVAGKVFDGSTRATLVGGSLVGLVSSDAGSVSLNQSGNFTSTVPSSSIRVRASDTLSGAAAANYTLAEPTDLIGNITPNPLMPNAGLLSVALIDPAVNLLGNRTAPLTVQGDAGASAGTAARTQTNRPERRRLPELAGLNISVVEDGIKLPAASGKQSP
jgi:filamentous hemagglutinin family protein